MISPSTYNITCPQGATYNTTFTVTQDGVPLNLTGYTAALQVRDSYTSADVEIGLTAGSGITLGGTAGTINVVVSSAVSAGVAANTYVYDLELYSGGTTTRLLQGFWKHTPEVTR